MASSKQDSVSLFRSFIAATGAQDWDTVASYLEPRISAGDVEVTAEQAVAMLKGEADNIADLTLIIDQVVPDRKEPSVFARVIVRGTLREARFGAEPSGNAFEFTQLFFVVFTGGGKISRLQVGTDIEAFVKQTPSAPRTPSESGFGYELPEEKKGGDMEQFYRKYLAELATSPRETMIEHYTPVISYNAMTIPMEPVAVNFVAGSQASIENGLVTIEGLVLDEVNQRIGVVLKFTGVALKEHMGRQPGEAINAYEFAIYYRNGDGKFESLWSIFDLNLQPK